MSELQVPTVTVDELPAHARILDVREQFEWDDGHIDGALHVPMNDVPARVMNEPDLIKPDERIFLVCAVGGRSGQVTAWLARNGYDAVNVAGGMHAWQDAGRPVVRNVSGGG